MNWYKIAQNNDEDIMDLSPLLQEVFDRELLTVMKEMQEIIREKKESGEWGILGQEHFIPRPGTWINLDTTDEDILNAIALYGDFPVVLKWAVSDRETIPVSEYLARKKTGALEPKQHPEIQQKLMQERNQLEALGPQGKLNPEVKERIEKLDDLISLFPLDDYLREVFVQKDFEPVPQYDNDVIDFRQEQKRREINLE